MPVWLALGPVLKILAIGLTAAGLAGGAWWHLNSKERAHQHQLEQIKYDYEAIVEEKEKELAIQEETNQKLIAEVKWARHHVEQREIQIKHIKENASPKLKECLDMRLDLHSG